MLEACALPGLEMTGLFQHFSVADDTAPENVAYTACLLYTSIAAVIGDGGQHGVVGADITCLLYTSRCV